MLRLDDFAENLLTALEVALKAYAAGDEKDAYQLTSPFAPYIATRRAARVPAEVEPQVEPRARRAPALAVQSGRKLSQEYERLVRGGARPADRPVVATRVGNR